MTKNKIRLNIVFGGILVGILLLGIAAYIIFFPIFGKTIWSSREENNSPSITTCSYSGLWIKGTPIRIVVRKTCAMI